MLQNQIVGEFKDKAARKGEEGGPEAILARQEAAAEALHANEEKLQVERMKREALEEKLAALKRRKQIIEGQRHQLQQVLAVKDNKKQAKIEAEKDHESVRQAQRKVDAKKREVAELENMISGQQQVDQESRQHYENELK